MLTTAARIGLKTIVDVILPDAYKVSIINGKRLFKNAILRFYQENILTKPRVCVMIFSASDKCSFAAIKYLGV